MHSSFQTKCRNALEPHAFLFSSSTPEPHSLSKPLYHYFFMPFYFIFLFCSRTSYFFVVVPSACVRTECINEKTGSGNESAMPFNRYNPAIVEGIMDKARWETSIGDFIIRNAYERRTVGSQLCLTNLLRYLSNQYNIHVEASPVRFFFIKLLPLERIFLKKFNNFSPLLICKINVLKILNLVDIFSIFILLKNIKNSHFWLRAYV